MRKAAGITESAVTIVTEVVADASRATPGVASRLVAVLETTVVAKRARALVSELEAHATCGSARLKATEVAVACCCECVEV